MACSAQENSSPHGFFPQSFVNGTSQASNSPSLQNKKSQLQIPLQKVNGEKPQGGVENALLEERPDDIVEGAGIGVHSIGLIVNGLEQAHFKKELETLIDTATRFDLLVSQVAAIGLGLPGVSDVNLSDFMFSPHALSLVALEGQLAPYPALPTELAQIKTSPTWVVNTEKGTFFIEGFEPIWTLFNSKGEFLGDQDEKALSLTLEQKGESLFGNREALFQSDSQRAEKKTEIEEVKVQSLFEHDVVTKDQSTSSGHSPLDPF